MIKLALVGMLIVSVIGTAIAVINSKYRTRVLFVEIQRIERTLDDYEVEWGKLQLEYNTLAEHGRVEKYAHEKLGMVIPKQAFSISLAK